MITAYVRTYVCNFQTINLSIYVRISYKAVCPAGCFNGGNCSAPGICTCLTEWTGKDCRQGMECYPTYVIDS